MRRVRISFGVLAAMALWTSSAQAVQAPSFTITPIAPARNFSEVFAVSDTGVVIGFTSRSSRSRAFSWQDGGPVSYLPELPSTVGSSAYGISRDGEFIAGGDGVGTFPGDAVDRPVRWHSGKIRDLGDLGAGGTHAVAINDSGMAAGGAAIPGCDDGRFNCGAPVMWGKLGRIHRLDTPRGYPFGEAQDINDDGEIVGTAENGNGVLIPVYWDADRRLHRLPTFGHLGQAATNVASAVNDNGVIVGALTLASGDYHGVIWKRGRIIDLGADPESGSSVATDINDHGAVAGLTQSVPKTVLVSYSVKWQAKTRRMIVLRPPVTPRGWHLETGGGINDEGWMVGDGTQAGVWRTWLLRPAS